MRGDFYPQLTADFNLLPPTYAIIAATNAVRIFLHFVKICLLEFSLTICSATVLVNIAIFVNIIFHILKFVN